MEVSVDVAERDLKDRQARTLPMSPGVALGIGCFLTLFSAGMLAGALKGRTALGTHLRGELPRYWQLEVAAKGADPIHFLVPVYRA